MTFFELFPGLGKDYTSYYRSMKEDSPESSRRSMLIRLRRLASTYPNGYMLDLGAGRQILERQWKGFSHTPLPFFITTLDIADLANHQLLAPQRMNARHIRGNGSTLPFKSNLFNIVICNMALDFMSPVAKHEMHRVTKDFALVNLHHPSLLDLIDFYLPRYYELGPDEKRTIDFWLFLRDSNVLYQSEDQIIDEFQAVGFEVQHIALGSESHNHKPGIHVNRWWEVDLKKCA